MCFIWPHAKHIQHAKHDKYIALFLIVYHQLSLYFHNIPSITPGALNKLYNMLPKDRKHMLYTHFIPSIMKIFHHPSRMEWMYNAIAIDASKYSIIDAYGNISYDGEYSITTGSTVTIQGDREHNKPVHNIDQFNNIRYLFGGTCVLLDENHDFYEPTV